MTDVVVVDQVAVERAATVGVLRLSAAERAEVVRRLAAAGLSDGQIGTRIDRCARQVGRIRAAHGIAPGVPSGRRRRTAA